MIVRKNHVRNYSVHLLSFDDIKFMGFFYSMKWNFNRWIIFMFQTRVVTFIIDQLLVTDCLKTVVFSILSIFITIRALADDNMRQKCVTWIFNITWHFLQGCCYLCGLHQYNWVPDDWDYADFAQSISIQRDWLKRFDLDTCSFWMLSISWKIGFQLWN